MLGDSRAVDVLLLAQRQFDSPQGEEFGKASPVGLALLVVLLLAIFGLVYDMNRRVRKMPATFDRENPADDQLADFGTDAAGVVGGAGSEDAVSEAQATGGGPGTGGSAAPGAAGGEDSGSGGAATVAGSGDAGTEDVGTEGAGRGDDAGTEGAGRGDDGGNRG